MRNASGQQGAASKVKMNASGKKKKRRGTQALKTKYLVSTRIQNVTGKCYVVVVQSNVKEMYKKSVLLVQNYLFGAN